MKKIFLFLGLIWPIIASSQIIDPSFDPLFAKTGNTEQLALTKDHKILVKGDFNFAGDQPVRSLVRLLPDGQLDTAFSYDDSIIDLPDLFAAQSDGKIVIGGAFYNTAGTFLGQLLRLHPDGQLDSTFVPLMDTTLSLIQLKILPNQKLFLAYSRCDLADTQDCSVNGIKLLNSDGQPDLYFTNLEFTPNDWTNAQSLGDIGFQSDNALLVVGVQLQVDTLVQDAYRFDSLGQVDLTFDPDIRPWYPLFAPQLDVAPGGKIGVVAADRNLIFILDSLGNQLYKEAAYLGPAIFLPPAVFNQTLAVSEDEFLFNSDYNSVIIRDRGVFPNTITNMSLIGPAADLVNHPEGIIAAGQFYTINERLTGGLVRFQDRLFRLDLDLNFKPDLRSYASVDNLALSGDGKLLAKGNFNYINGNTTKRIAQVHPNGALDTTFILPNVVNPLATFHQMEVLSDGTIVTGSDGNNYSPEKYLSGLNLLQPNGALNYKMEVPSRSSVRPTDIDFLAIDSEDRIYACESSSSNSSTGGNHKRIFVQYELTGPFTSVMKDLNKFFTANITGLEVLENDQLMVYGWRLRYDGADSTGIIKINPDGNLDQTYRAELPTNVLVKEALVSKNGEIFATGIQEVSSRTWEPIFYKLYPDGRRDFSFAPSFSLTTSVFEHRLDLYELPNGLLIVSGTFDEVNGVSVPSGKVLMDTDGVFVQEFLPEIIECKISDIIVIDEQSIYLSGKFRTANGTKGILKIDNIPQLTTNTNSLVNNNKIELFPNPVLGRAINLKLPSKYLFQNFDYSILEVASGRVVQNGQLAVRTQNQIALPSHLQGAYIIQLKNGATNLVQRFIVQDR